jgi:hypothetical protein
MSGLLNFDPWAAIGKPNPHAKEMAEAAQRRLDAELRRAERDAIENEPRFPPPGSEARKIIDLNHERIVRGLLLGMAREPKRKLLWVNKTAAVASLQRKPLVSSSASL